MVPRHLQLRPSLAAPDFHFNDVTFSLTLRIVVEGPRGPAHTDATQSSPWPEFSLSQMIVAGLSQILAARSELPRPRRVVIQSGVCLHVNRPSSRCNRLQTKLNAPRT